jgi:hypothetical protein
METSEEAIRIAHELGIRTPLFCTDIMPEDFEELQMKEVRLRILFEQLQLQRPKRDFKYKTLKSKLIAWSYHLIQEALTRDSPLLLSAVLNEKLVTIHDSVPVKESRYYIGDKIIWHYDFNWNTNLTSTDSATDETMSLIHFAIFWKARESILFLIRSGADIYDKKALRVMCSSKDMNASERIHKYFRKDENFLKEINSFVESQKAAIGRKMQNG